jgi:hypothetical protein
MGKNEELYFTLRLGKIRPLYVVVVTLCLALVIGYFNQTTLYRDLNLLPQDRDELLPIRATSTMVVNETVVVIRVIVKAIVRLTFTNIYDHLTVWVRNEAGVSFVFGAKEADRAEQGTDFFEFSKDLLIAGDFIAQFYFFDTPFNKETKIHTANQVYSSEKSVIVFDGTEIESLQNVCFHQGRFITFWKKPQELGRYQSIFENSGANYLSFSNNRRVLGESFLYVTPKVPYASKMSEMKDILSLLAFHNKEKNFIYGKERIMFDDVFRVAYVRADEMLCFDRVVVSGKGDNGASLCERLETYKKVGRTDLEEREFLKESCA